MTMINWDNVDESCVNGLLEPGDYLVKIATIENKTTRAGDQMWRLRLDVQDEENKNLSVWDNLVFVEKALPRIKMLFSRIGIDLSGNQEVYPSQLIGQFIVAEISIEEYRLSTGEARKKNVVTFAGYKRIDADKKHPCSDSNNTGITNKQNPQKQTNIDEPPF